MTFFTSLTGLNAAQTELSSLANNIANVNTSGFKRSRVEFADIVNRSPTQAAGRVAGAGVAVAAVTQQFAQGGAQTTSSALDLMIGGPGFFLVRGGGDRADSLVLSRNGAFQIDAERYVVDNEGRRLQVLPVTPDGAVTGTGAAALRPLRIPATSGLPRATTEVRVIANLPASAPVPLAGFDRNDPSSYTAANSVTVYDAEGRASTLTLYYRRIENPDPLSTDKWWEVRAFRDDVEVSPSGPPVPLQLVFNADGVLTSPAAPTPFGAGFSLDVAGTTQLDRPFAVSFSDQNGYAPGRLEGVGVGLDGLVRATFSNGEVVAIGKVALGNVPNPQGLRQNGNVSWMLAQSSGPLEVGEAGADGFGTITGGALERSNVDLTEELVGLINAQRTFQANARAIDTASALLQTIVNLRST
ncbi:MAG: flagellar hook protein FlgE [Sphingomonadaceae bacterium]|uniref:flagellar hook protein FlgE n=1 Tax=Thermaurantiacus sp. TaxID=2820283 RepID=UPI00298F1DEF|nr:flagellar hook protein FlgE [Thermaurantiacus sp.]MCS6985893.1 flagellar hook protein FlgE [Sphingomonadaceae bacterium]MDW8414891.1 flagellar hook protein FlgE [Thermaurantiacus sp.]